MKFMVFYSLEFVPIVEKKWIRQLFYSDGDSQSGDGEGGRYRNNGHENFFEEMSTDLKPSLAYKFWAQDLSSYCY